MLRVIDSTEKELWNTVVTSFSNWDIYYLCEYARSLESHEHAQAFLVEFVHGNERLCYPVMQKDIAADLEFRALLPGDTWYDWETPYGYGGPLSNTPHLSDTAQWVFQEELTDYCRQFRIVTQFVRFHPLLQNQSVLDGVIEYKTMKDSIYMDLASKEVIFQNLDSKNRNMIRKAQKSGVTVFSDYGEHLREFMEIYRETMDRDHAEAYYYFDWGYYDTLLRELHEETIFFYAELNREIIAASIFFYNDRLMHYHLSGVKTNFRKFAPTNLLLYEAACWGARRGMKALHLGGGVSREDSLFGFKKQFNKTGRLPFYIGRMIFDHNAYKELLQLRQKTDLNFDPNNPFYIQYRKPRDTGMGVFIIAEAGDNHNGSFELALKLVDAAKDAGADCVKFQTFVTEEVISTRAEKADYQKKSTGAEESQYEMVKKLELSFEQFRQIKTYCDKIGIRFLSTAFDIPSVRFLKDMDMPFWKIPSGEITNLPYLIEIAKTGGDVVMSTGMCEPEEIQSAIDVLRSNGAGKITLLHCNTEYPTPFEDVNLRAMETMRETFHCPVGYSDHTRGIEVPIAAAALGAVIVEKHFTLDKTMEGPDHKASLEPDELRAMVSGIRNIERVMGNGVKRPSPSEVKNIGIARKSITARRTIKRGETLTEDNLAVKRPGNGVSPMRWFEVLGTKAVRDFEKDELIEL